MALVALQSPMPAPVTRPDKATPSAHALPPAQIVPAVPDQPTQGLNAGMPGFRDRSRDAFDQQKGARYPEPVKGGSSPQPFPSIRFADPLPYLPELDLPGKKAAYDATLNVLRGTQSG